MSSESTTKTKMTESRQKFIALKARIKYRQQTLQHLTDHLKKGTFPKRMKSVKPYPKMDTSEAQTVVNKVCQQVDKVILGQMIQEQERTLKQERDTIQALKKERLDQRKQRKAFVKKLKSPMNTVLELQRELKDLQTKYMKLEQTLKKQEPQES